MSLTVATLDDLRTVVAQLLDHQQPLVVGRQDACRLLDVSDTTFSRLLKEGAIRPVPHLRPPKYSTELLARLAAGDANAFAPPTEGPDHGDTPGSPVPLRPRRGRARGASIDGTAGEPSPPAA